MVNLYSLTRNHWHQYKTERTLPVLILLQASLIISGIKREDLTYALNLSGLIAIFSREGGIVIIDPKENHSRLAFNDRSTISIREMPAYFLSERSAQIKEYIDSLDRVLRMTTIETTEVGFAAMSIYKRGHYRVACAAQ